MQLLAIVFSFLVLPEDKCFLALLDHSTKRALSISFNKWTWNTLSTFSMWRIPASTIEIFPVPLDPMANAEIAATYSGVQICPSYSTDTTPLSKFAVP